MEDIDYLKIRFSRNRDKKILNNFSVIFFFFYKVNFKMQMQIYKKAQKDIKNPSY